ncbi:hypothetical protein OL239_05360 [Arthrobacter sp. ATA002]|uniref:hypothetical protein n=1 Tax=Arthrobacter sp. ATA002 TaxID=2991715 RepID=UPI0022A6EC3D|nr:hypothetical protein [Arthrobacter sp. ATA002]WAP52650.1 hypothetical protein OL239_05360 [Arthrobacter sp. ATA002]
MGIRYYAYAFDGDQTREVLADPSLVLGSDPYADACGLEPGFTLGVTEFKQSRPERDFLYLDKAWRYLQWLTAPCSADAKARPAHRMFEGQVAFIADGYSWHPWVRALAPDEVSLIAQDLKTIRDHDVEACLSGGGSTDQLVTSELTYVVPYLHRARSFADTLSSEGRGCVYLIG